MDSLYHRAAELLRKAQHGVVLTGAGLSTPSGIPDFRSPTSGMWQHANPMEVASMYGFRTNPTAFYDWIRPVAGVMRSAEPNPAHYAIVEWERQGLIRDVITQNIDTLHTRAGSNRVHEVHGSISTGTCVFCYRNYPMEDFLEPFLEEGIIPHCPLDGGLVKPDVVLFGEALPHAILSAAQHAARHCDLMIVAGSSLEVAPASQLPQVARAHRARLMIINYEPTYIDDEAIVIIREDVAVALPMITHILQEG